MERVAVDDDAASKSVDAFGVDFGPRVDLTVRIREILRNYPEGSSVLKEMIQNADDAGARKVVFAIDERTFRSRKLANPKLAQFQGPALLVHNDGMFTESDFNNIRSIGGSLKKEESRGTKTGRFGIGFNSIYHITDLPSFVSNSRYTIFDPHTSFLNVSTSNPGKSVDFVEHPEIVERFCDQFEPLNVFGCDTKKKARYEGTTFRLPLRTQKQAETSKLSSNVHTVSSMIANMKAFAEEEAASALVFLKHVESIRICIWRQDASEPETMYEVSVSNVSPKLRSQRRFMVEMMSSAASELIWKSPKICDYHLRCVTAGPFAPKSSEKEIEFLVAQQFGGVEIGAFARDISTKHMRLVPWGGVAVARGGSKLRGKAYTALPLPCDTKLPVACNGYFELSSNRRDVWHRSDDLAGDGALRAQWNRFLLQYVVAPSYARLLMRLAKAAEHKGIDSDLTQYFSRFPVASVPEPWNACVRSLFSSSFAKLPLLRTCDGIWVSPNAAVVADRSTVPALVVRAAQRLGFRVVSLPTDLARVFRDRLGATMLTPSLVFTPSGEKRVTPLIMLGSRRDATVEMFDAVLTFAVRDLKSDAKRSKFYASKVVPHVARLRSPDIQDAAMLRLLRRPDLIRKSEHLALALRKYGCIRNGEQRQLCRVSNLFSPRAPLLRAMLDAKSFPDDAYCEEAALSSLDYLGLKTRLRREDVIQVAKNIACGVVCKRREDMARRLLAYMCARSEDLLDLEDSKKSKGEDEAPRGLFGAFFRSTRKSVKREKRRDATYSKEVRAFLARLRDIAWIPVDAESPSPFVPWHASSFRVSDDEKAQEVCAEKSDDENTHGRLVFMPPCDVRPIEDRDMCSATKGLCRMPVDSITREMLGWDRPVDPVTIAQQLCAIASLFSRIGNDGASHDIGAVVFRLYDRLNRYVSRSRSTDAEQLKYVKVMSVLSSGGSWVLVNDNMGDSTFASPKCVAFGGGFSAPPYLFLLSASFASSFRELFRTFGVRKHFGVADLIDALRSLKEDEESDRLAATAVAADDDSLKRRTKMRLDLSIALANRISDDPNIDSVKDSTIVYLPTDDSSLTFEDASKLVFDDMEWLRKKGAAASLTSSSSSSSQFVHPKISRKVARKLGVQSLRETVVMKTSQNFGVFIERAANLVKSYGPQESLTRRLRSILTQYAEGCGVLHELIQNADDAGARVVKIMYSSRTWRKKSLIDESMKSWQGHALYLYNDAEFTESDFNNLARIGQASKMEKLSTTGRFGLGFNCVYHWTDCPSFVSGDHIVFFDPHTKYVPGATSTRPGIRVRFAGSDLCEHFRDQFEPYRLWGCDMKSKYRGTIFRFPLRTDEHESEISSRRHSREEIESLLSSFKNIAAETLLFLRNVDTIEVYVESNVTIKTETDFDPHDRKIKLLWRARLDGRSEKDSRAKWTNIPRFLAGGAERFEKRRPQVKDQLYAQLRSTPGRDLPYCHLMVSLTLEDGRIEESTKSDSVIEGQQSSRWIVCQFLGAGSARAMAVDPKNRSMKLIPWAGIAARVPIATSKEKDDDDNDNEKELKMLRGKAFCFLPLPVHTGMPVHINGYFELSSNRRSIWTGDDLEGRGKVRAQWNRALLLDVAAPTYVLCLNIAKKEIGWCKEFLNLFPGPRSEITSELWGAVADRMFNLLVTSKILKTDRDKRWVSPRNALLADAEDCPKHLVEAVLQHRYPVVTLGKRMITAFVERLDRRIRIVSSTFVREHFKKHALEDADTSKINDRLSFLEYAVRDLVSSTSTVASDAVIDAVDGLRLLPLANGDMGTFKRNPQNVDEVDKVERTNSILRVSLEAYYQRVAPTKVGNVDAIIQKYGKDLDDLKRRLLKQYAVPFIFERHTGIDDAKTKEQIGKNGGHEVYVLCTSTDNDFHKLIRRSIGGRLVHSEAHGLVSALLTRIANGKKESFWRTMLSQDSTGRSALNIDVVDKSRMLRSFIIPNMHEIDSKLAIEIAIATLRDLAQLKKDDRSFGTFLESTPFIVSASNSDTLERPKDLYDPEVPIVRELLAHRCPAHAYAKDADVMIALRSLGLRRTLSQDAIVSAAKGIAEAVRDLKEVDAARLRAKKLILFLDLQCAPEWMEDASFVDTIRSIPWIPVAPLPNDLNILAASTTDPGTLNIIPWSLNDQDGSPRKRPPVMAPRRARPASQVMSSSASYGIFDGEVRSSLLSNLLGWESSFDGRGSARMIAHQIIGFARKCAVTRSRDDDEDTKSTERSVTDDDAQELKHRHRLLKRLLPPLYQKLQDALESVAEKEEDVFVEVKRILDSGPWIWDGERQFFRTNEVAFRPPFAPPFLNEVPPYLALSYGSMLKHLGVREIFDAARCARALEALPRNRKLSAKEMGLAVALCSAIAASEGKHELQYLPASDSWMRAKDRMLFNDTPWLEPDKASVLLHADVSEAEARQLRVVSRRQSLLLRSSKNSNSSATLCPCPSIRSVKRILRAFPQDELIVSDLLEVADIRGSRTCSILLDERCYGMSSLIDQTWAKYQGPALVVHFDCALSPKDLVHFLLLSELRKLDQKTRSESQKAVTTSDDDLLRALREGSVADVADGDDTRGRPRRGAGLLSSFLIGDCLQILTGTELHVLEPLTEQADATSKESKHRSSRTFSFVGTDMVKKFKDQFSVFASLPFVRDLLHPFHGTLLRIPLRFRRLECESGKVASSKSSDVVNSVTDPSSIKKDVAIREPLSADRKARRRILRNKLAMDMVLLKPWSRVYCKEVASDASSNLLHVVADEKMRRLMSVFGRTVEKSLLFSTSLTKVQLSHRESCGLRILSRVCLSNPSPALRQLRSKIPFSRSWKQPKTGLSGWFATLGQSDEEVNGYKSREFDLTIVLFMPRKREHDAVANKETRRASTAVDDGNVHDTRYETWRVRHAIAPENTGPLAREPRFRGKIPFIAIAKKISTTDQNGVTSIGTCESGSRNNAGGHLFCRTSTGFSTGLPVDVDGDFSLVPGPKGCCRSLCTGADANSPGDVLRAEWNKALLAALSKEYVKLLFSLRDRYASGTPSRLYDCWPSYERMNMKLKPYFGEGFYEPLCDERMFLCNSSADGVRGGLAYRSLSEAYISPPSHTLDPIVSDFLAQTFSFLRLPVHLANEFQTPPASTFPCVRDKLQTLSAKDVRRMLKCSRRSSVDVQGLLRKGGHELCVSLTAFCLETHVNVDRSTRARPLSPSLDCLLGLPLIPLMDGGVGTYQGPSSPTILISESQRSLMGRASAICAHPSATSSLLELFRGYEPSDLTRVLGLSVLSPDVLARNLHRILPRSWHNAVFVRWNNGSSGEISRRWISTFWSTIDVNDRASVELFSEWPLLPTVDGNLVSCSLLSSILVVSRENQENRSLRAEFESQKMRRSSDGNGTLSSTTEKDSDVSETEHDSDVPPGDLGIGSEATKDTEPKTVIAADCDLYDILRRLGVPLLELAYFPRSSASQLVVESTDTQKRLSVTLACCLQRLDGLGRSTASFPTLRWSMLESRHRTALLDIFSSHSSNGATFTDTTQRAIRTLPIFRTLQGKIVSIQENNAATCRYVTLAPDLLEAQTTTARSSTSLSLPLTALGEKVTSRVLRAERIPEHLHLLKSVGVREVDDKAALVEFIFPNFTSLPFPLQDSSMDRVKMQWDNLRGIPAVVEGLKGLSFLDVPGRKNRVRASDLLDPRNEFFRAMFMQDEPERFPEKKYLDSARWMDLLSTIGLQTEVKEHLVLDCASKVASFERHRGNLKNPTDISRAQYFVRYLWKNFADFYSAELCRKLSAIEFVPAVPPEAYVGSNGCDPLTSCRLYRYRDVCAPRDGNVVWSVRPVIDDSSCVPPALAWQNLGLCSSPKAYTVIKHLERLTESGRLDRRWAWKENANETFRSIFSYLQKHFSELSVRQKRTLRACAMVPVSGGRLVRAENLFFELDDQAVGGLLFKVPRAFGQFDTLFRSLGSADKPRPSDLRRVMSDLRINCGDEGVLSPNEIASFVRMLNMLVDEDSGNMDTTGLFVPDCRSTLVSADRCVWPDNVALANRIESHLRSNELRLCTPVVPIELARRLNIPRLSDVVREETYGSLQDDPAFDVQQRRLQQLIKSKAFGRAICGIVESERRHAMLYRKRPSRSMTPVARDLPSACRVLKIRCVRKIATRLYLRHVNERRRAQKDRLIGTDESSTHFLDRANRTIYLVLDLLPADVLLEWTIAGLMNTALGSPIDDISKLAAILRCKSEKHVGGVLRALGIVDRVGSEDDGSSDETEDADAKSVVLLHLKRGDPGARLIESDRSLVRLTPMRIFTKGEIVAWSSSKAPGENLRYGVVVSTRDADDSRIRSVQVRCDPRNIRWIPTTEIYSFLGASSSSSGATTRRQRQWDGKSSENRRMRVIEMNEESSERLDVASPSVSISKNSTADESGVPDVHAPSGPLKPTLLLDAVDEILGRAGMSLNMERADLIRNHLTVKSKLENANAALVKARASIDTLRREREEQRSRRICQICLTNEIECVLVPCGHTMCKACARSLRKRECPFDRRPIQSYVAFFKG